MIQRWQFKSFRLPGTLEELDVQIEGFAKIGPGQSTRVEPVSGSVTLVFGVGSMWTFSSFPGEFLHAGAVLSSVKCLPQRVTNDDLGRCLEVSLPHWLASEFFSPEIVSTPSPLKIASEFNATGKRLADEVLNSPDIEAAAGAVIKFLCDRQKEKRHATRPEVQWAWKRLTSHRSVTVESLAKEIGWSERHFVKTYSNAIGCNPKRSQKLARFASAYQMLFEDLAPIADVAVSAGYYDQSHMIRDFRDFAGLTPKQVRRQEAQHLIVAG